MKNLFIILASCFYISCSASTNDFVSIYIQAHGYQGNASQLADTLLANATIQNIDPSLALAIIETESSFKPNAKSHGNLGLFQINLKAHRKEIQLACKKRKKCSATRIDINVELGTQILSQCVTKSQGNLYHALLRYNASDRKQAYAKHVLHLYYKIRSLNKQE